MKYRLLFSMALFFHSAFSQTGDSFAILHVDSLIQYSRVLREQGNFEKALEVNAVAEKLALEKLGRESATFGNCCFNRGWINDAKGDYTEAEIGYLEAKAIWEKSPGKEHKDYAATLNNLANLYKNFGKYQKAEQLLLEAIVIWGKTLGKEHIDYAAGLNNLANLYNDMAKYEKAEPLYLEALAIREKVLGKEHLEYARSLNNLANFYKNTSNFEKAEKLYFEAKAIWENALGKEDFHYADCINNLAGLYLEMGMYEKAEPLYLEAKTIREKVLGKEHSSYASSLNNLAVLYSDMGHFEKAELLYLEALSIRKIVLGKEHPDYASNLNNLAANYIDMGNFEKAEPLYLEAQVIREKVFGKDHLEYARSLNNLAGFYLDMGNFEKAEQLCTQAKTIRERALGTEHPAFATSLANLAIIYRKMGNFEKAEPLEFEAKTIREKVLGKDHPSYASSLNNLANLYRTMGNFEKAELLHLEAKDIRGKMLGKEHPNYAASLHNLAILYHSMGRYKEAMPLYHEALDIRKKVLGEEHPEYGQNLSALALFYEEQSLFSESTPLLAEALSLVQTRITGGVSFLSERELSNYSIAQKQSTDQLNMFLFRRPVNQVNILPVLSYNQSLFQKGFLMQAASRLQILAASSPESARITNDLKSYRRRISKELSKPIAERKGLEEMEEKANLHERELARTVAGYDEAMEHVQWEDIQAALSETSIALEFVHFGVNFPDKTDSILYAVLLVRSGMTQPQYIPLFDEKEIYPLQESGKERKSDYVNELYTWANRGMVKLGGEKKSLYELIWKKIETVGLEGIQTIYYSPSSVLHRLNLGAIAIDEKTILSDRYNLVALNSTRQLVIPASVSIKSDDAILVGGVNFEADTINSTIEYNALQANRAASTSWTEADSRIGSWSYLNWTEQEVENISTTLTKDKFNTILYTGSDATEESFKVIGKEGPSPRILHIATHGFFFPDPKEAPTSISGLGETEPAFKWSDNPMIRSGLILAGGNYAWKNGKPVSPEKEDGILTAYEISQMNLSNTELVVLSACETGLGDIQGNEGVYGLQRAFKIAGAKYLIMSLWQVPDRETMEFMTTFYKNWLPSDAEALAGKEGKMTIPDAFRKTQREMRDRFYNPYSWAAFVLVE